MKIMLKLYGFIFMLYPNFYEVKQLVWVPVCFHVQLNPPKKASTLKGKNLLLVSKFFPLRVDPIEKKAKMKLAELRPQKIACTL